MREQISRLQHPHEVRTPRYREEARRGRARTRVGSRDCKYYKYFVVFRPGFGVSSLELLCVRERQGKLYTDGGFWCRIINGIIEYWFSLLSILYYIIIIILDITVIIESR